MAELPLYDTTGKRTGSVTVDEKIFGERIKRELLKDVVVWYGRNKRLGTASTKTRSNVAGSTRKPWKQKHTGRARAGSIRSPIWRHGGVVFGPHPRDYSVVIPQKMRKGALDSALLWKIRDNEVHVIEDLKFEKPSTKQMAQVLKNIGIHRTCVVSPSETDNNTRLSLRNLSSISYILAKNLNAYDITRHKDILLTRSALEAMVALRGGKASKSEAVAGT